jgi:predicted nucleotide-binding protein
LFEGHLGVGIAIICKRGEPKMASDLQGIIYCNIEKEFRLEEELGSWMHTLELSQMKTNLFT